MGRAAKFGELLEFMDSVSDLVYGGECGWDRDGWRTLRSDLRDMVGRLRRDKERLDWLDRQGEGVEVSNFSGIWACIFDNVAPDAHQGETIRDAIDSAMEED